MFKDLKDFRLIGKSLDRLDARAKVDGSAIYGMDVKLPGLLTAVIVRPPVRGGTIRSLDASAAKAAHGVVDVVRIPEGVGVVAKGYWKARTGAERLRIEWNDGPNAALDTDALAASYARLTQRKGKKTARDVGDAYAALGRGQTLDVLYRLPYLAHATMEPQNATAMIRNGRCDVWAPPQAPSIARYRVAEAIGFDTDAVAIH